MSAPGRLPGFRLQSGIAQDLVYCPQRPAAVSQDLAGNSLRYGLAGFARRQLIKLFAKGGQLCKFPALVLQ